MMAWTPDRAPQTNPLRSGLAADASYDREAIRKDVDYMDNDQQNPPAETKWWEVRLALGVGSFGSGWVVLGWGAEVFLFSFKVRAPSSIMILYVYVNNK